MLSLWTQEKTKNKNTGVSLIMYKYQNNKKISSFRLTNFSIKNIFKKLGHKNKKNRTFDAIKFLLVCLVLVVSVIAISIVVSIFKRHDVPANFASYDNLIWPVVMQDPKDFDEKSPIEASNMISAAIWLVASREKNNPERFNKDQRLVLSLEEVQKSAKELFNKSFSKEIIPRNEKNFFKFDFNKNEFLIDSISGSGGYWPRTISAICKDGETILRVGYVLLADDFDSEKTKFSEKIQKYKTYYLKTDPDNGYTYISAVK